MAHYGNNDRYADPYQQNQYASYDQTPYGYSHDAPQHQQYGYASNETPNYSTPDVQHGQHQQQQPDYYTSTDKINENSAAVGAGAEDYSVPVERERKGRQNVGGNSKSWAQGPPPRSTGILRMWRKDERGKQWTRVCPDARRWDAVKEESELMLIDRVGDVDSPCDCAAAA